MRYYLRIEVLDRDGNIGRMRLHMPDIVTGVALEELAGTIAGAINGISDGYVRRVWSELSEGALDVGMPLPTGLMELSAIFIAGDEAGHIYTNIIPAIADDMITSTGPLAGIALSSEAIDRIVIILQSVPVMSKYNSLVVATGIEGARVS